MVWSKLEWISSSKDRFNSWDFLRMSDDFNSLSVVGRFVGFCCSMSLITPANYLEYRDYSSPEGTLFRAGLKHHPKLINSMVKNQIRSVDDLHDKISYERVNIIYNLGRSCPLSISPQSDDEFPFYVWWLQKILRWTETDQPHIQKVLEKILVTIRHRLLCWMYWNEEIWQRSIQLLLFLWLRMIMYKW